MVFHVALTVERIWLKFRYFDSVLFQDCQMCCDLKKPPDILALFLDL